ncbi:MAG: hypothetical protein Unbinned1068contig1001_17 [Prokaryotic dsDNA virus sp.]|nr:MAG: hypothetical protein Unbinned1068contig1001_17 [Prokaryotic dsDNA virus sp.]|tara:strand:+ start:93 stop:833 length:741 start_codon:yes stop_codon:yes gene_type:complete
MAERKLTEAEMAKIRERVERDGAVKAFYHYRDNLDSFGGRGDLVLAYASELSKDEAAKKVGPSKKGKRRPPTEAEIKSLKSGKAVVRNKPVDLDDPRFDYADAEARGRRVQRREALAAAAAGRELTPEQEAAFVSDTGPGISDYLVGGYLTSKGAQHLFRPEGTLRNLDKAEGFLPKGLRAVVKGVKAGARAMGNVRVTTKTRQEAAKKLAESKGIRTGKRKALEQASRERKIEAKRKELRKAKAK